MKNFALRFPCDDGYSPRIDDDAVMRMAQAVPKFEFLQLGAEPYRIATGVTANGLAALVRHWPNLSVLCVHFRVASTGCPVGGSKILNVEFVEKKWKEVVKIIKLLRKYARVRRISVSLVHLGDILPGDALGTEAPQE